MKRRHGEIVHSSVWTPNNKKEVNDMFTNGATVVEICKFLGINKSTWYRWLKDPRKKDFQEICEECKKLGQSSYSEDYIQGVLDSVSPEYPLNSFTKEVRQEESSVFDFEISE